MWFPTGWKSRQPSPSLHSRPLDDSRMSVFFADDYPCGGSKLCGKPALFSSCRPSLLAWDIHVHLHNIRRSRNVLHQFYRIRSIQVASLHICEAVHIYSGHYLFRAGIRRIGNLYCQWGSPGINPF